MGKFKEYNELEKTLIEKYKDDKNNVVRLNDGDFDESKLSSSGYNRIKQECKYISYKEEIEVIVPKQYESGYRPVFESMAATELSRIKKERCETIMASLVLLFAGMLFIFIGSFFDIIEGILREIVVIASWVFIWAAIEKWFFRRGELRDKRLSLLQILAGKTVFV